MELENSQQNQETKWGGARPGSGRKPMHGEEEIGRKLKRKFNEYVTEEEIEKIVAMSVKDALDGKGDMQRYLMDQFFGKARQNVGLDGGEGKPIQIIFDEAFKEYVINREG